MNVTQQCRWSYFELGLPVVSLAISKPCRVEVKLQVKIVITNPLPCPSHITDAKTESGLVDGFPSMNIFLQADTPTLFSRLFSSYVLLAGFYPVLTDPCILLC